MDSSETKRPLLVLDLDETLVSADDEARGIPGEVAFAEHHVVPRPGLAHFLRDVRASYDIAIWTASTAEYAAPIVRHFVNVPLVFLWARARCTLHSDINTRDWVYLKDIKKLVRTGYAKERILIVDDTPAKIARSYGNYVRIAPFEGDLADEDLKFLAPYLLSIAATENMRSLDKRGWRNRAIKK
ncbi:MAG: HAD family hydrolase [Polyangiales bacterium]